MIILLAILICCAAFLSGSETSLFSLSPIKLRSYQTSPNVKKRLVAALMKRPRDVLVTLLMLNILINILIQNTVANLFTFGGWWGKVGLPLALILLFGEILPKSLALPNNTAIAEKVSPLIYWTQFFLKPVRIPITKITSAISRMFCAFLHKEKPISSDELRHVVHTSEEKGILLPQECDLIEGALNLHESIVKERMRPRDEVLYFDLQDPISRLEHLFVDQEITRIPVCQGSLENLLGILSLSQYLGKNNPSSHNTISTLLSKPYFVPETMKAWNCLKHLREAKEDLAVVIDEYGSISGIITQEDLIEAVVGEIHDRRDTETLYTKSSSHVIIASGKLELAEFKEIFGISLKSKENIVTLGGWLVEQLGDIPPVGTQYSFGPFLFYILAADPNRIRKIYVRRRH